MFLPSRVETVTWRATHRGRDHAITSEPCPEEHASSAKHLRVTWCIDGLPMGYTRLQFKEWSEWSTQTVHLTKLDAPVGGRTAEALDVWASLRGSFAFVTTSERDGADSVAVCTASSEDYPGKAEVRRDGVPCVPDDGTRAADRYAQSRTQPLVAAATLVAQGVARMLVKFLPLVAVWLCLQFGGALDGVAGFIEGWSEARTITNLPVLSWLPDWLVMSLQRYGVLLPVAAGAFYGVRHYRTKRRRQANGERTVDGAL